MKILYIIALVSFAALAFAAFAIARHVRRNAAAARRDPAIDQEMAQAIDLRLSDLSRPSSLNRPYPERTAPEGAARRADAIAPAAQGSSGQLPAAPGGLKPDMGPPNDSGQQEDTEAASTRPFYLDREPDERQEDHRQDRPFYLEPLHPGAVRDDQADRPFYLEPESREPDEEERSDRPFYLEPLPGDAGEEQRSDRPFYLQPDLGGVDDEAPRDDREHEERPFYLEPRHPDPAEERRPVRPFYLDPEPDEKHEDDRH